MGGIQSEETFHARLSMRLHRFSRPPGLSRASALAATALPRASAAEPADPALIDDVVAANRILYDQGVVDGFGHVSARHDKDPSLGIYCRVAWLPRW